MHISAGFVSVSIEGDYYQVSFEEHEGQIYGDGDYLIIQRQFEMPNGGKCYLETHNQDYVGHFRVKKIEFRKESIVFEFDRQYNRTVEVALTGQISDLPNIQAALEIIQGKRAPYVE